MAKSDPILVVGGGLGGLTAALALARKGWRVRVFEQTPEFGAIGYGIQLGPNVFPMFERLGLTDAMLAESILPRACIMFDALTGAELVQIPDAQTLRARFGHPYVVIHRVDLHNVLLEACRALDTIELVPLVSASGFEQRSGGVTLNTEDGRAIEGAAIVAADGLRSVFRAKLVGDEPRPTGYVAHRTILPMDQVPDSVQRDISALWIGPGFHLVHYPLRHNTLFNIVAVFRTGTYGEKGDTAFHQSEVDRTYRDAHPVIRSLLSLMNLERRWAIADRDPVRRWSEGRVTLLGDAAHPALQTFAQGACMAIEDGVCLAETVAQHNGDFERAFVDYAAARCVRTARVQLEGRHLWEGYHAEGLARDMWLQMFSQTDTLHCLRWLYNGIELPNASAPPRQAAAR